jgi:hypothetical protein
MDWKPFVGGENMEQHVELHDDDKEVIDFVIGTIGWIGLVILAIISAL